MKFKLPLIAAFVAMLSLTACGGGSSGSSSSPSSPVAESPATLTYSETVAGTGATVATTSYATIKYTGWLYSASAVDHKGTQFDTGTINPNGMSSNPLYKVTDFVPGFTQGITGAKAGAKRTIYVPGSLGYGAAGIPGKIPANAGLVFDVEIVAVF